MALLLALRAASDRRSAGTCRGSLLSVYLSVLGSTMRSSIFCSIVFAPVLPWFGRFLRNRETRERGRGTGAKAAKSAGIRSGPAQRPAEPALCGGRAAVLAGPSRSVFFFLFGSGVGPRSGRPGGSAEQVRDLSGRRRLCDRLVARLELRQERELSSPALDHELRAHYRDDLALAQARADGALDVRIGVRRIAEARPFGALLEEFELVLGGQEEVLVKPGRIVVGNVPERVREPPIETFMKLRPRKILGDERQERVREFRLLFGAVPLGRDEVGGDEGRRSQGARERCGKHGIVSFGLV